MSENRKPRAPRLESMQCACYPTGEKCSAIKREEPGEPRHADSPHCAKCKHRAGESLRLRVTPFSDKRDKTTGLCRLRLEGGGILEVMKPFCMLTALVFTHYVIFFFSS